jgi:hypothetical protein
MARLSKETLQELSDNFDTMDILYAVDQLDEIRALVADRENYRPPEVRDNLLKLHKLVHSIINEGHVSSDSDELWNLAYDIEDDIYPILENAEKILDTLRKLTALAPDEEAL